MSPALPLWSYQPQRHSRITIQTRRHLEAELFHRVVKDESFRQRLLADPKNVLARELGIEVEPGTELRVFQESAEILYLVLPANPFGHLSEAKLESSGLTLDDVARWMLEQQRTGWPNHERSAELLARAWRDANLRRELLAHPAEVLTRELGSTVPEGAEIVALAEQRDDLCLILPAFVRVDAAVLGEEVTAAAMESVAGSYLEVVVADTHVFTGSCCITTPSDRNLKDCVSPVDGREVLDSIAALGISTWSYKVQGAGVRHMGPMAQDFFALLGLGEDDRHINLLDLSGVALAGIQGLRKLLFEKEEEIAHLVARAHALEGRIASLESRLGA
jgi:hypothetical protein